MLDNDPTANTSQQFVLIALILTLVTLFLELDQLNFNEELLHEEEKIVALLHFVNQLFDRAEQTSRPMSRDFWTFNFSLFRMI